MFVLSSLIKSHRVSIATELEVMYFLSFRMAADDPFAQTFELRCPGAVSLQ
jgi:hypothetical protein